MRNTYSFNRYHLRNPRHGVTPCDAQHALVRQVSPTHPIRPHNNATVNICTFNGYHRRNGYRSPMQCGVEVSLHHVRRHVGCLASEAPCQLKARSTTKAGSAGRIERASKNIPGGRWRCSSMMRAATTVGVGSSCGFADGRSTACRRRRGDNNTAIASATLRYASVKALRSCRNARRRWTVEAWHGGAGVGTKLAGAACGDCCNTATVPIVGRPARPMAAKATTSSSNAT